MRRAARGCRAKRALLLVASLLVALSAAVPARRARAEGDATTTIEPLRVRFDAPAGCPDGAEFLGEVLARTSRVRAAKEGEPARVFRVSVARSGALFRGKLIVEETEHARKPRLVSGESCRDVVGALALIAALAVDPRALTGPTASPFVAPASTSLDGGAATEDSAAPLPAVSEDASTSEDSSTVPPPLAPTSSATSAPPASSASPAPQPPGAPWVLSAGATFDLVGAGGLGAVFGGSAFLDASRDDDGWFRPSVRLGVSHYGETSLTAGPASVRFAWTVGGFDLCAVALRLGALSAKPCLSAEAGGLQASPSGPLSNGHDQLQFWFSAGALALLDWRMFRFLAVEAYGGLRAPITRNDFVFQPANVYQVYTAPPVMVTGGLGVGVYFP